MAPWSILLWWPLRKAALVPAVVIGVGCVAGFVGAADLSVRAARLVGAGTKKKPEELNKGTQAIAGTVAVSVSAAIVSIREAYFKPAAPPALNLPVESVPISVRLSNASRMMMHSVQHYPYRFRFFSVIMAGSVAGVTYVLAERAYNNPASIRLEEGKGASVAAAASSGVGSTTGAGAALSEGLLAAAAHDDDDDRSRLEGEQLEPSESETERVDPETLYEESELT